ncbi:MAG: Uma2 family endonuclease [Lachnospiraceae bacterium]|nr:Uma2 family endonuclease [Lachnospiraceae bacterium]
MSAQPQEKMYTIDDIEALPEGQRAELVDGVIYDMATPTRTHQRLVHHLDRIIGNYIVEKGGSCEINPAPFAVYLNQDDYNYFEPDITVVCDPSKLDDKGCHGAPDWIIEIVSPSSRSMDYIIKMFRYSAAGVREYWIVDPEKDSITVYDFKGESGGSYTMSDVIPVSIYDGDLQIDFSALSI